MKYCQCNIKSSPYNQGKRWHCQYCGGILTDLERVKKIIDFNTPINIADREKVILDELLEHIKLSNFERKNTQLEFNMLTPTKR